MHEKMLDRTKALAAWLQDMRIDVPEDTPQRIVQMYHDFLYPTALSAPFKFTMFPNDEGMEDMVIVRDITFYSMCEHHLIPFFGKVHVGYLPHERIVGLSKIPRVVDWYARRPQLQERMTAQIADYIRTQLRPKGTIVVVDATHLCVAMRGIKNITATTTTSALRGVFLVNPSARNEFFRLIGR